MMTEPLPELKPGFYEHYKHHLYEVYGLGLSGRLTTLDPDDLILVGIARYSEDETRRFAVMRLEEPNSGLTYIVFELVMDERPPLELHYHLVIYEASDHDEPSLWVRPLEGEAGFITRTSSGAERFTYLGPERPASTI